MSDLRMELIQGQLRDIEENVRSIKATWGNTIMTFDNIKTSLKADRQKAIDEAYQKGFESGQHEATTLEYEQGLNDAWEAAKKISLMSPDEIEKVFPGAAKYNRYNLGYSGVEAIERLKAYEEQQKADAEIKVGDIITDGKINYLVIDITDKSYIALQGTDFEPAYIGKDYIKSYHNLHDSKDMRKMAEEINKAMEGDAE